MENILKGIKLFDLEYYEKMGFYRGVRILKENPSWANRVVLVYTSGYGSISGYIENEYFCYDYLYREEYTMEEIEKLYPELLI